MRIPFIQGPGTVGREDRLVRGSIALSLLLLAGFAVAMSGDLTAISILVLVGGGYFSVTAALGHDPFYAHAGIDTRADAELAPAPPEPEAWSVEPQRIIDLRTAPPPTSDDRPGTSALR